MKKKRNKIFALAGVFVLALIISGFFFNWFGFLGLSSTDKLVQKAGYPEVAGRKPTFYVEIKTPDSTTHVISYLPESLLPLEKFHEDAAKNAIEYVEKIAKERNTFTFNPNLNGGSEVSVKLIPRTVNAENFVFLLSQNDPLPAKIIESKTNYSLLEESIDGDKTFFWTMFEKSGSTSIVRFTEPDTWKNGLPTRGGVGLSPIQQLNTGFNIEIWKRSVKITPLVSMEDIPDHDKILFDASESLWNTFGQLTVAKQEGTPVELLQNRYDNRILSKKRNRAYYPLDEKAKKIFTEAPANAVIK